MESCSDIMKKLRKEKIKYSKKEYIKRTIEFLENIPEIESCTIIKRKHLPPYLDKINGSYLSTLSVLLNYPYPKEQLENIKKTLNNDSSSINVLEKLGGVEKLINLQQDLISISIPEKFFASDFYDGTLIFEYR